MGRTNSHQRPKISRKRAEIANERTDQSTISK